MIRRLGAEENPRWLEMRQRLWPEVAREELVRDQAMILGDPERHAVFVAHEAESGLVGFVEVSFRDWAEGCAARPVGYLEGWYVEPSHRRGGIGRRLVEAAERWVLDRGCAEIGSDADLGNPASHRAHRALGFREVGREVLFAKQLKS